MMVQVLQTIDCGQCHEGASQPCNSANASPAWPATPAASCQRAQHGLQALPTHTGQSIGAVGREAWQIMMQELQEL